MIKILTFCLSLPFYLISQVSMDTLLDVDLQYKNLTKLPSNLNINRISSLYIGHNLFTEIPNELASAENMKVFSMDFTKNLKLEAGLEILKKSHLQELSLNNCNLMYIPIEFGEVKSLHQLSLKNNFIKSIPEYIFIHGNFTSLDLEGNQIKSIPSEIKLQQNLSYINLSDNNCINENSSYELLKYLPNLNELVVRGSSSLPINIWEISSLKKIDISDGDFNSIITHTTQIQHSIQELIVNNCNKLDFNTLAPILKSNSIKELSLGGNNFNGFENITLSSNITKLHVSGENLNHFSLANKLPKIDELILNFKNINCKEELLKTISEWNSLTTLNLSSCQLIPLPNMF